MPTTRPPRIIMRVFYAGLKKGESRSRVLQQAKIALRNGAGRESHPFYWAPLILVGRSGPLQLNELVRRRRERFVRMTGRGHKVKTIVVKIICVRPKASAKCRFLHF
ncbi:MAG: CHAT domain-containing protein [bacterium]